MSRFVSFVSAACALLLLASVSLWMPAAGASHADGTYDIPVWFTWDTAELDVLIVPPNHGQLYNGNGALGGGDPMEATPLNSYLEAIETSIDEWHSGIGRFGADWLKDNLVTNVYVLGRDVPPPDALRGPEIVIVTDETKGPILGVAVSTRPCVVDNSKFFTQSFTYQDMYNVNAHEFGHCLGLNHIVDDHPQRDVMDSLYRGPLGSPEAPLHCVSNLDVAGLERVFGGLFGNPSGGVASVRVNEYATTCSGPSEQIVAPAPTSSPSPAASPSPASSPSPEASPSPEPSPSREPAPEDSPSPEPSPTDDDTGASERGPRCPEGARCGTPGDDLLIGTAGDDVIYGFDGNDVIRGKGGNDQIFGGKGKDKILGAKGNDRLHGGPGHDDLRGGPGRDVLKGARGRDVLRGGRGPDVLRGGRGRDTCIGGKGRDRSFGCERA